MDNNFGGLEKAFDTSEPKPKKTRAIQNTDDQITDCLLYTSPSPRD